MAGKMDVDQRMSLSLDDIIKSEKKQGGTRKPSKAAGKPSGRVKVALSNSQKPKNSSGKQQKGLKLGVQKKGLKVQNVGKRRAAVPLKGSQRKTGKAVPAAAATGRNTRAGRTNRTVKQPNLTNVKVTIRNDKALRNQQQPRQQGVVFPATRYAAQQTWAPIVQQQLVQQAQPSYGYGPRNLQPREAYTTAVTAQGYAVPPRMSANPDYGAARRTLGIGNVGGGHAVKRAYVDYDASGRIMRMDAMR